MTSWAIVRFEEVGFHRYPDAPGEVTYLQERHRHKFFVEVWVQQFHDNRDLEYHILRDMVIKLFREIAPLNEFDAMSCEMIASDLRDKVMNWYKGRRCKVTVFEDNENGGRVDDDD